MIKEDSNMSALDIQVGGNHYKKYKYQPIEYFMDSKMNPLSSNISKYILRYRDKNGLEDLEKALQYSEIGIEKYMNTVTGRKNVSETRMKYHSIFIEQLDESLSIEKDILTASIYEDYKLCNILISDLIDKEYSSDDTFDYFGSLLNFSIINDINVFSLINSKRHDGENFYFMLAFVFVLHKYDISINKMANSLKCEKYTVKNVLDKAYSMLDENNNSFIFEMETMFNHIESERL